MKLKIQQSMHLSGDIEISGAKNAALPIMCSSLLYSGLLTLHNVPDLEDVRTMQALLCDMGVVIDGSADQHVMQFNANRVNHCHASYEFVKAMRASILVLGPLLARFGEAKVSLPGGCAIGARPVGEHIKGLELMGAEIYIDNGYIYAKADRLHGAKIVMNMITVTGTENLLLAAVLATGTTVLENCACEPEVIDLARCLIKMGADIKGVGTNTMIINGVKSLSVQNVEHTIIPDRIETGTYMIAAAITMGDIFIKNTDGGILDAVIAKLEESGSLITTTPDSVRIVTRKRPRAVNIMTAPYPALATDMQAQFMALNTIAVGNSIITETIFENRYMHVPELQRMGAQIEIIDSSAIVTGRDHLTGTEVEATDLRASAALVLAALVAEHETCIDNIHHLRRGYDNIEDKLQKVGAKITCISDNV